MITQLNHEDRLIDIRNNLIIYSLEVSCQSDWGVVPDELVSHRCLLEIDIIHSVSALITPVGDDRFPTELHSNSLLPLVLAVVIMTHFHYTLQTSLCSHELEDIVHS